MLSEILTILFIIAGIAGSIFGIKNDMTQLNKYQTVYIDKKSAKLDKIELSVSQETVVIECYLKDKNNEVFKVGNITKYNAFSFIHSKYVYFYDKTENTDYPCAYFETYMKKIEPHDNVMKHIICKINKEECDIVWPEIYNPKKFDHYIKNAKKFEKYIDTFNNTTYVKNDWKQMLIESIDLSKINLDKVKKVYKIMD